MTASWYSYPRCGAKFGIAGDGFDSDADEYFDTEVEYHESGECAPESTIRRPRPNAELRRLVREEAARQKKVDAMRDLYGESDSRLGFGNLGHSDLDSLGGAR